MIAGVQPGCLQSGLLGETASASKSEVTGVDSMSSTQVPASESTMKSCWNAVTDAAGAIWSFVLGITRWILDCMSAPSRSEVVVNEVGVSTVHDLLEAAHLFTALKNSHPGSETKALLPKITTAYNKLNPLVKQALQTKILSCMSAGDTYVLNKDGTVDIIDAAQHLNMPDIIIEMTQQFPSVQLNSVEERFAKAITDATKVTLLYEALEIEPSDLDSQITHDVLNTRVFAIFDGFEDLLKINIYAQIRTSFRRRDYHDNYLIKINGIDVSIADDNFPVLAFRSDPRDDRIMDALSVFIRNSTI